MAARKTAAAKPTKAPEAPETADQGGSLPLGSVWSFPAADRVAIIRPDGAVIAVDPDQDGMAHHILNLPGDYSAPGVSVVCA